MQNIQGVWYEVQGEICKMQGASKRDGIDLVIVLSFTPVWKYQNYLFLLLLCSSVFIHLIIITAVFIILIGL